ncbi:MAG: O-antigen ligase family protein [Lachnoclostridium sp.]|nr:O-antigen ligase family protein [Lachnospira sp.]MCM1247004.1 O-antigen ligase family protein [Lachnoclostridium sp.]
MSNRKAKRKRESIPKMLQGLLAEILDWIICIYMFLILAIMPFYHQEGYTHIGTDKSYFFRQCARKSAYLILPLLALYLVAAGVVFVREKRGSSFQITAWLKTHFSVTDWFALAYGLSVLLSYACSAYKKEALIGTQGWYMGLYPQLAFIAGYFLISRMWKKEYAIPLSAILASAAVFLLGIINCFGIYPIDMKVKNTAFISTIGNVNWYCGYLTAVFFGGLALFWQMDRKQWKYRLLLGIYVFIGFTSLVTQGSSSGIVALAAVLFVLFCLSAENGRLMRAFWEAVLLLSAGGLMCRLIQMLGLGKLSVWAGGEGVLGLLNNSSLSLIMTAASLSLLLCVVSANRRKSYPAAIFGKWAKILGCAGAGLLALFIVILVVNTLAEGKISNVLGLPPDNPLTFTPAWGSNRGATWRAGIRCFLQQDFLHKLVGAGPDCMSAFLYNGASEELTGWVENWFAGSRLTNAHNEWLTILINEGVLGCICYVGMMCSAIWRFLKDRKRSIAAGACGFCVLAYTANNLFSFQQSMNAATIFIIMGMGENFLRENRKR